MKWAELTLEQLGEARERAGGVAIIPIGSLEGHGKHLPLGCDTLTIESVADRVAAIEPVVVLPPMTYTFVPQSTFQPGGINIRSSLLTEFLVQVLDAVHRNGFGKIVLIHGHGDNFPMHETILQHVLETSRPYALYSIPPWAGIRIDEVRETPVIGHACEIETSIALALFPKKVHMELAGSATYPRDQGLDVGVAQTPVDWIARFPGCVMGEPQVASAAKGEKMVRMWVDAIVDSLRKIKTDQVVPAWMIRSRKFGQ